MEASSPREIFVASPGDTAPVEKPLFLEDSTRLALRRKIVDAKEKLYSRTRQERKAGEDFVWKPGNVPPSIEGTLKVTKTSIRDLPDAVARDAQRTIKMKLSAATKATLTSLGKAKIILEEAKSGAIRKRNKEVEPTRVHMNSDSEGSSPTRSPTRSPRSISPCTDAEENAEPPVAIEVFNGLGMLGAELKKQGLLS